MASAFERVPGAVVEDGILMHVGNPLVEQRRLVRGDAVAPLENRSAVSVTGPAVRVPSGFSTPSPAFTALMAACTSLPSRGPATFALTATSKRP